MKNIRLTNNLSGDIRLSQTRHLSAIRNDVRPTSPTKLYGGGKISL